MENEEKITEVSKNQQRKKAQEVLIKAKKLVTLSKKQIIILEYPEEIKLELLKTQKIKSKSARLRQIKYIAKLLRSLSDTEEN